MPAPHAVRPVPPGGAPLHSASSLPHASTATPAQQTAAFEALLCADRAAFIGIDAARAITTWSAGACRLLGYSAADVLGHELGTLFPGLAEALSEGNRSAGSSPPAAMVRHRDGAAIAVEVEVERVSPSDGVPGGSVVVLTDVSERNRLRDELDRVRAYADTLSEARTTFLECMSHELRTPLTSIIGFADLLQQELEDERREFAELIGTSGNRLLETLTSLIDLASFVSERTTLDARLHDPGRVVEDALAPYLDRTTHSLAFHRPTLVRPFEFDAAALQRVVRILVSNAFKFTPSGGSVRVTLSQSPTTTSIDVVDTGVGIDEAYLPHLFEPFSQQQRGLTRTHQGSGLGLSIAKRFVNLMGGSLTVTSEAGAGTRFRITLPHNDVALPPHPQVTRQSILVVEDNPQNRRLMTLMLNQPQMSVDVAESAQRALDLASEKSYDLLIIDINLGDSMNGADLARQLRATDAYRDVPLLACTAYAMPEDAARFLQSGFDAYLAKPFTKAQLYHAVATATGKRRQAGSPGG